MRGTVAPKRTSQRNNGAAYAQHNHDRGPVGRHDNSSVRPPADRTGGFGHSANDDKLYIPSSRYDGYL